MKRCMFHVPVLVLIGLAAMIGASRLSASDESARQSAEQSPASPIRKTVPDENRRIPDQLQPCATNLAKIHAAVKKYEQNKGRLPDWLSDLVPDYLQEKDLLCPVHRQPRALYWPDPKLPCSYNYEFSAIKLSDNWGPVSGMVCRDWKTRQVKLFGDVVPMIRCFHQPSAPNQPSALSVSSGGQAFWGLEVWERVFMPEYQRGDELDPSERPFRYVIPTGGVDELVKFIEQVKALRPKTPYQTLLHGRIAPAALKAAATRILETERDEWSTAYQTALRVLLEDRIRALASESPAAQRETIGFVKDFLTAKREKRLDREDANLAMSAAKTLEDAGNRQLAAEAYREFGSLLATSKDEAILDVAKKLETAAKRLQP